MGIPLKGSRKITVDEHLYTWMATGNDHGIDLVICDNVRNGQKLQARFDYQQCHDDKLVSQQFVITPAIVRQVILLGLRNGWTPTRQNPHLQLGFLDGQRK